MWVPDAAHEALRDRCGRGKLPRRINGGPGSQSFAERSRSLFWSVEREAPGAHRAGDAASAPAGAWPPPLDGRAGPLLLQVDSRYTFKKAERGRPHVGVLVAPAWNADGLEPLNSIAATVTSCGTDLPRIRFVMDAEVPVVRGTRRIRESREE